MNPQDPLAALHPLREPELIGWWPLAPGWWLLIALAVLLLACIAVLLWRRHQSRAYRRQATQQLKSLRHAFNEGGDVPHYVQGLSRLLKATALQAYPREEIAAISGEAWPRLLNATMAASSPGDEFPAEFSDACYRAQPENIDTELLYRCAQHWIDQHEVRR